MRNLLCSRTLSKFLMPTPLASGKIVFVPCEITPGMASNEREIKIDNPEGVIRAFVSLTSVANDPDPESLEKRDGWVKAVIVALSKDDVRLLFAGQDVDPTNPAPVSTNWLHKNAKPESFFNGPGS